MEDLLIELQYAGPIQAYACIASAKKVFFEQCEHYVKASYRNRMELAGPNGPIRLSIPLVKGKNQHTPVRKVRISYDHAWQQVHWRTIESAYRSTPFFEFYEEELFPFYHDFQPTYLFDFNNSLMNLILEMIGIETEIAFTERFYHQSPQGFTDKRNHLMANKRKSVQDAGFIHPVYRQVFEERTGFIKGLSILDLLFNKGPSTKEVLQNCYPESIQG